MKTFVAGATGAIGRFLVPRLVEAGHQVVALVRDAGKVKSVEAAGATAVLADALNRREVTAAITKAEPEVIIHQLTAIPGTGNFRRIDQEFALTNRLRTEATDTLLAAGRLAGTRRFIAQSYCGWPFAREGGPVKTEEDALDPNPPACFRKTFAAIRYLEDTVRRTKDLQALALRYGIFYGPGSGITRGGLLVDLVLKRRFPIVGDGAGVWSFIHLRDAANATVAAVAHGDPGVYNIVDDEPAPVRTWLPALAAAVGAKAPYRMPVWIARLAIGDAGVSTMTAVRGGSNTKAKRELPWELIYPSWRRGFIEGLGP
jgi:nucleoside-diphosphate-sugar epimerase